jgi:ribonuclease P protein component
LLPAEERLTQRRDFAAVYGRKRSWTHPLLVLYVRRHGAGTEEKNETRRFGFSVSKKVGKAHDRNRVKRRLRAICRAHRGEWRLGFDAVFVARTAIQEASYRELEAGLCDLMRRADLVAASNDGCN